jgi:hypothetical protein
MGLAGQGNLSELLNAQSADTANQSPIAKIIYPPDTDLDEPRGPIKTCVESRTAPDGSVRTNPANTAQMGR